MFKLLYLITLLSFLFLSTTNLYSQDLIYTPNQNLDYVAVNNEIREGTEEGFLKVVNGDNVKISGKGNPNSPLYILYEEEKIEASIDNNGNWFVVFTILDLPKSSYPVYLEYGNSGVKEPLITLVVIDTTNEQSDNDETEIVEEDEEKSNRYLGYILIGILIPIFTSIGWFLGSYSEKNKKR